MTIASKEQAEYDKGEREELIELNINKKEFCIIGFIDDMNVRACRVGSGTVNGGGNFSERRDRTDEGNDLQKAFYR